MACNVRSNECNNCNVVCNVVHKLPNDKIDVDEVTCMDKTAKTLNKIIRTHDDLEDKDSTQCGWGFWKPKWTQSFNNAKGYLVFLSIQGFLQNMILGSLFVVITTLEKRFNLSSVSTGTMVSCYDIASMSVVVFVSYFGERGNIPRWVGFGGLIIAAGSFLFSLPHFLTGDYNFEVSEFDVCNNNRTISEECDPSVDNSGLSKYLYLFMFANVLMGVGGSPTYTLGVTYMDENVMPEVFGLYMGIFNAAANLGPGLGYLFGGFVLTIYTDIQIDRSRLTITPDSPVWVGAWWLAFIIGGVLVIITSIPLLGFPKKPPGAEKIAVRRKSETQIGAEFKARQGFIASIRDFPLAMLNLIKNVPFVMLTGIAITEWFTLTGMAVFTPKYLESQFNLSVSQSAVYTGAIFVVSGVFGPLFSGWVVQRLKLSCLGQIKLCLILTSVSALLVPVFAIHCEDVPLAGVTVSYNNSSLPISPNDNINITSPCNQDCNCEAAFNPVCGANNVMYYTACHAGCQQETDSNGNMMYTDCTCVMDSEKTVENKTSQAVGGRCSTTCHWKWVFILLTTVLFTFMYASTVPTWTATMRCVSHSQRALGLGLQTVFYSLLGTIPGPIVYGLFIDQSCLIWEYTCDGAATCWLYDNKQFAHSFLIITVVMKVLTLLFFAMCISFYRPVQDEEKEEKTRESLGNLSLINIQSTQDSLTVL